MATSSYPNLQALATITLKNMGPLYAFSLIPVLSISLLLCLVAAFGQRKHRMFGLAMMCASISAWSAALLITSMPQIADWGRRFNAIGAFLAAGYLHAAYDLLGVKQRRLVWLAYLVAALITGAGIFSPGLLYDPLNLLAGPMFWPAMALAIAAASLPMLSLAKGALHASGAARRLRISLILAGLATYIGAWSNALLLSYGYALPYGLFLVLAGLLITAQIIANAQSPIDRKLLDRSLWFSSLMALLWAAYLFGLLSVIDHQAKALIQQYRFGALFLFCMAALAFEPLRLNLQERLGQRIFGQRRQHAPGLAQALLQEQERAEHLARQAELGIFTSAIAHEVRNPLGVLQAHLKLLELQGADAETLDQMRDQIQRASHFLDELLSFGRPSPLTPREVDLSALLQLAASTATQARANLTPAQHPQPQLNLGALQDPHLEADHAQLLQLLIILLDNAILATLDQENPQLHLSARDTPSAITITIEDNGPGIPKAIAQKLFEPFVTSRPRDSAVKGTGLGLAIAQSIAKRHHATLSADRSPLGGARFTLTIPRAGAAAALSTPETP